MVELCFLALTSTPSMGPSSAEVTCPANAGADCASAPVDNPASTRRPNTPALVKSKRCFNRMVCLPRLRSCLNYPSYKLSRSELKWNWVAHAWPETAEKCSADWDTTTPVGSPLQRATGSPPPCAPHSL